MQQPAVDPAPYDLVQHLAGKSTRLRCCLTTACSPQHAAKRAAEGWHPAAKHITPADAAAVAGTRHPHSTGNLAKCSRTACTRRMQACIAKRGACAQQPTSCFSCVSTAAKARRKHTCSDAVPKASGFIVHCPAAVCTCGYNLLTLFTETVVISLGAANMSKTSQAHSLALFEPVLQTMRPVQRLSTLRTEDSAVQATAQSYPKQRANMQGDARYGDSKHPFFEPAQ